MATNDILCPISQEIITPSNRFKVSIDNTEYDIEHLGQWVVIGKHNRWPHTNSQIQEADLDRIHKQYNNWLNLIGRRSFNLNSHTSRINPRITSIPRRFTFNQIPLRTTSTTSTTNKLNSLTARRYMNNIRFNPNIRNIQTASKYIFQVHWDFFLENKNLTRQSNAFIYEDTNRLKQLIYKILSRLNDSDLTQARIILDNLEYVRNVITSQTRSNVRLIKYSPICDGIKMRREDFHNYFVPKLCSP